MIYTLKILTVKFYFHDLKSRQKKGGNYKYIDFFSVNQILSDEFTWNNIEEIISYIWFQAFYILSKIIPN
jgi:hypothetical protein